MSEEERPSVNAMGEDPFADFGLDWLEDDDPASPSSGGDGAKDTDDVEPETPEEDLELPSRGGEGSSQLAPWLEDDIDELEEQIEQIEEPVAESPAGPDDALPPWLAMENEAESEEEHETHETHEIHEMDEHIEPVSSSAQELSSLPPWLAEEPAPEPASEEEGDAADDDRDGPRLEELIAGIDREIEETFGSGAMADLAPDETPETGQQMQHILFRLVDTDYAVPITSVSEIGEPPEITPVPNVPEWVRGVANLRGEIISVVDLRAFLGLERDGHGQSRRMMVAQAQQEEMTTGLIVDRVGGIQRIPMDRIYAPTAPVEDNVALYMRGVYEQNGRLVVILKLEKLLLSSEMRQFEPM
jgi:chemotaxis signal transduction protein